MHDALEGLPNLSSEMSTPKYGGVHICSSVDRCSSEDMNQTSCQTHRNVKAFSWASSSASPLSRPLPSTTEDVMLTSDTMEWAGCVEVRTCDVWSSHVCRAAKARNACTRRQRIPQDEEIGRGVSCCPKLYRLKVRVLVYHPA